MWQNTAFMLRTAWRVDKNVIFLCAAVAGVTAGNTTVELLIAPAVLRHVENAAPLGSLLGSIAAFALLIMAGLPSEAIWSGRSRKRRPGPPFPTRWNRIF